MLDLSNNQLKEIPTNINELVNLSVLNISGNRGKFFIFNNKYESIIILIFLFYVITHFNLLKN